MHKKGYYRFADIGMFIISFAVIGVVIGMGIFIFYSHQIDIRGQEAEVLSNKIVRAVIDNGLNDLESFDIFREAGIDINIINNGDFYFKVEIIEIASSTSEEVETAKIVFEEGNRDFEVECGLRSDKFPVCDSEELIVNNYKVKILTASNQLGERI